MGIEKIDTIQKHLQFMGSEFFAFFAVYWPGKAILFKPFKPQAKSVSVPVQYFHSASGSVAEKIKVSA